MRAKTGGRPHSGPEKANLFPVEVALIVLMRNPGKWVSVGGPAGTNALAAALRRRGCELWQLNGITRARWSHDVPTVEDLSFLIKVTR